MSDSLYPDSDRPDAATLEALSHFIAIVRRLRRDCPWDREQTHASVRHLLIEEAYETVESIEKEDWGELRKELGDLLLHVVFHGTMAEEDGRFTLDDVIRLETEKLVRRHPHVFGNTAVSGTGEVLQNWEKIKMTEGRKSLLEGVPQALPALLRAFRVQEKAAGVGFDFPTVDGAWDKVEEELAEVRALAPDDGEALEREWGDLFFALVNYARMQGVNPENALQRTNRTFSRRFAHVEARLREAGRTPAEATLEEMDAFWDEAKRLERGESPVTGERGT